MAGSKLYRDDDDLGVITDINVTPFVDVVLVLLVVFIVTAKLIVARGIEIDKPKAATGGEVQSTLRVSINKDGELYVNGDKFASDAAAVGRIKEIAATTSRPKAIVAGDRRAAYAGVMHAIDLVQQAGITAIALENERPE
ncbi:MAG: biopolymer transporter ExbD [Deltaproteobacteria bacterium]|nr:MAG: biopolymer transporter ExbD [Deltaproteobacteria bacterium]TMQ15290.1 MAG: biopolymer transporter ExbD [Deltaproteobacteria bacterium]